MSPCKVELRRPQGEPIFRKILDNDGEETIIYAINPPAKAICLKNDSEAVLLYNGKIYPVSRQINNGKAQYRLRARIKGSKIPDWEYKIYASMEMTDKPVPERKRGE